MIEIVADPLPHDWNCSKPCSPLFEMQQPPFPMIGIAADQGWRVLATWWLKPVKTTLAKTGFSHKKWLKLKYPHFVHKHATKCL